MIAQRLIDATKNEILQGDIFRMIPYFESVKLNDAVVDIDIITFPYVIVLTQVCDLTQEDAEIQKVAVATKNTPLIYDKKLISILVAPMYNYAQFSIGEHTSDLGYNSRKIK